MMCEICGKSGRMYRVLIEGSEMEVCGDCSKFGNVLGEVSAGSSDSGFAKKSIEREFFDTEDIIDNFSSLIKKCREKMGLTQEEVAKKIGVKAGVLAKIENGFKPDIELVKRLEKFFKIKLIGKYKDSKSDFRFNTAREGKMTIGDLLKDKD